MNWAAELLDVDGKDRPIVEVFERLLRPDTKLKPRMNLADMINHLLEQKRIIHAQNDLSGTALVSLDRWLVDAVELLLIAELKRQDAER